MHANLWPDQLHNKILRVASLQISFAEIHALQNGSVVELFGKVRTPEVKLALTLHRRIHREVK